MLDFIVQYWLAWVFGLIAACLAFVIKQYYKYKKEEQERGRSDFKNELKKCIDEALAPVDIALQDIDKRFQDVNKKLDVNSSGILASYKRIFYEECEELLEAEHITVDDFTLCTKDHTTYNELGGNHTGDQLYQAVKDKFMQQQSR